MMVKTRIACIVAGVKVRDVVRMLERDGWRLVRVRGSHHHYRHPSKPGVVTVPGSGNDDLAPGTLRSIYKQAGLDRPKREV
jgi:predicted RNA binding protein YcfA (HicA-like mRNA interferase family)